MLKSLEDVLRVWDEIVMCDSHCIDALNRSLENFMQKPVPSGEKKLVSGREFCQIISVNQFGSGVHIPNACVRSSSLYHCFQTAL